MRYLRYTHELLTPLIVVGTRFLLQFLRRRMLPLVGRLFPSPAGYRIIGRILTIVAIIVQVIALVLLAELVELSISLMELWTLLAQKHLEITL